MCGCVIVSFVVFMLVVYGIHLFVYLTAVTTGSDVLDPQDERIIAEIQQGIAESQQGIAERQQGIADQELSAEKGNESPGTEAGSADVL